MAKRAVSVTLEQDNLLWLQARAAALKRRSLSEALDAVVTAARHGGLPATGARSVVGTVDIAAADPGLDEADDAIAELFAASLARPVRVREPSPATTDGSPRRPGTSRRSHRRG